MKGAKTMQKRLTALFLKNNIDCFGFLPLSACTIKKPYLLERAGISRGSVVIFAMPYYTHACDGNKNLSAYAIAKDYHLYFKDLSERLVSILASEFPSNRFAAFADHSPIDERSAAAMAGLGVIGKNGLLITEKYSSYVFLGEIITDAMIDCLPTEIRACIECGACERICPFLKGETGECLSSLTQRKGSLSPNEEKVILKYGSLWGCDLCQEVCPYTKKAKQEGSLYTPLSFFSEDLLPLLTRETLLDMDETAFASRAYSWRGREVILRNLTRSEKQNETSKELGKIEAPSPQDKP